MFWEIGEYCHHCGLPIRRQTVGHFWFKTTYWVHYDGFSSCRVNDGIAKPRIAPFEYTIFDEVDLGDEEMWKRITGLDPYVVPYREGPRRASKTEIQNQMIKEARARGELVVVISSKKRGRGGKRS